MGDRDYWVDVSFRGTRCGAGFLLTRRYVLTAAHCLRRRKIEPLDCVDIARDNGDLASGMVLEIDYGRDVALIRINGRLDWTTLTVVTDRCEKGDEWMSPYRPAHTDSELKGWVLTNSAAFECSGGETIEALELQVRQVLGDYSGYSGSPVQHELGADTSPDSQAAVIGMLIEQDLHRIRRSEATNVLFAITIAEAMNAFDDLQPPAQRARLTHHQTPKETVAQVASRHFDGARASISEIKTMVEEGLLSNVDLAEQAHALLHLAGERTIDWAGRHESTH